MKDILFKLADILPPGDRWKLLLLLFLMIFSSLLEVVGISLIPLFIAILATPDLLLTNPLIAPFFERYGIQEFGQLLYFGIVVIASLFLFKNGFIILYRYIEARYLWNRYRFISGKLFLRYLQAPYEFHIHHNSSLVLRNVNEETRNLVNNVLSPILKLTMNLLVTFVLVLLLLIADPLVSLSMFLLVGGIGSLLAYLSRKRLVLYGKQANQVRAGLIRTVKEGIGAIKEIRVFGRQSWFASRFQREVDHYTKLQSRFAVILQSNPPLMETVAVLGMLLITLFLYLKETPQDQMIAMLTLFGAAMIRLLPAVRDIVRDINQIHYFKSSIDPIHQDLITLDKLNRVSEKEITLRKASPPSDKDPEREMIRFRNVSYRYPGSNATVIRNLSFSIQQGSITGLEGGTGSGKTTLVDLMLGLLKPTDGSILFDGIELEAYQKKFFYPIGYVPQFIALSDDTLKRNIAFGLPDEEIDQERVRRALELSQLSPVVEKLPLGMETMIGENGVRFSGGQRQRIGIARALYNQPELLIMDEATSALDQKTEADILEGIEMIKGDLTILMITHRTETLRICDSILSLENGELLSNMSGDRFFKNRRSPSTD